GSLDLDLERTDAMVRCLLARVLGGDLGGVGRRLAAALEAHHSGRAPGNRIALRVGDRDHRIVEAGVHVSDAGRDILAFPSAETLRGLSHRKFLQSKKLLRTGGGS